MPWVSPGLKERWDPLAPTDIKAQEGNKVFQECREPGDYQDLLGTQGSQVSLDPKDLREFLVPPADQELKVNQELQARS